MANDPYAMCPCGSGKKLKFCCGELLPDLQRAIRIRDNQPDAAIRILQDLHRKFPKRDVVVRELAALYLAQNNSAQARQVCQDYLKLNPDQPMVILILAEILLVSDGFDASRRVIHRAFQLGAKNYAAGVSYLAAGVAMQMEATERYLSSREHLALAVRMSNGDLQKKLVLQLVNLEASSEISCLFRSAYPLMPVNCSEEAGQQDLRARKLSVLGCWEPAAILYNRLADMYPTESAVWYNLGLCQAWDGRHADAAASLHHASTLMQDTDAAVEAEALAQELDLHLSDDAFVTYAIQLDISSLSELITRLDSADDLHRTDHDDHSECSHQPGCSHVAEIIMTIPLESADDRQSDSDSLRETIADLDLYDVTDADAARESGIEHPHIVVTATSEYLDKALVRLRDIAGDLILTTADQENRIEGDHETPLARFFDRRYYRNPSMPLHQFLTAVKLMGKRAVESWKASPLQALGDLTPAQAAADPALRTKLAASLLVLRAAAIRHDVEIDLKSLREQLSIPQPQPLEIPENAVVASIPVIQYERLVPEKLTDSQLCELVHRSSALGHPDISLCGLTEIHRRESAMQEFGPVRACLMLSAFARQSLRTEEACAYIEEARKHVEPGKDAFRVNLELDIRELSCLLDNPDENNLKPLLHKFRDRYLHKIPEIEDVLVAQLANAGCGDLRSELERGMVTADVRDEGLWTPGGTSDDDGENRTLWLPGQE